MEDQQFVGDIRRARPEQADILSELAFRSKSHWGYDDAFLTSCRQALTVSPAEIATSYVYAFVDAGGYISGFYRFVAHEGDVAELDSLFVEPRAIGKGVGKRLWQHAVELARSLGFTTLELQSDPYAEGFYLAMGAKRCGDSKSTVTPGRMLPLMRYSLR
jgi:GNAT superfamily N-acetyltransferase